MILAAPKPRFSADYKETHKRLVSTLKAERRPLHYREAYLRCVALDHSAPLGLKTDPVEKLRQYYAEHDRPDILFVGNRHGYFVMKQWFPLRSQPSLLPPDEQVAISGDVLVSHDAGYEHAKREPHMMNHYGRNREPLFDRRRTAYLVERHVKNFFQVNYQEYYRPPENESAYDKHCDHDFILRTPYRPIYVDVKSWSYRSEGDGAQIAVIPNPNAVRLYLFADLLPDTNTVVMRGIMTGEMVKLLGIQSNGANRTMFHIAENNVWSIDVLLVLLNMAKCNLSWHDFENGILR